MLTMLQTAYTDTRAGDLAWCLGKDELPALAVLDRELPGAGSGAPAAPAAPRVQVQLRLLGASHQVILDSARGRCSETVACLPGTSAPLPFGVARRIAGWDYEFAARIETLSRGASRGGRRSCSRWWPITPMASRGRSRVIRTPSPRCSCSTAAAASCGAPGTRTPRKDAWWRPVRPSARSRERGGTPVAGTASTRRQVPRIAPLWVTWTAIYLT